MVGKWREEVTMQARNAVITEMCTQLLRLNGESDKEKLQQSVMKYERAVWGKANDKDTYLKTLRNKLMSFKQRQTPKDATPVSPITLANGAHVVVPESPQIKMQPTNDSTTTLIDTEMVPFPEPSLPQGEVDSTVAKLHEQYQQRRVELIKTQYSETQQCCQSQLMQQNQMTNTHIQQNVPMAARHMNMTMLQLQHDMARNNLMQVHMNQQNNLIQHHYQQLHALSNQEISL
ncbi:Aste57867_25018 [Aphanomyces stellatus]|uniref:Aste57867_25018 protein n=1 Tax=Aphanomyces stellatus TaxID=120398 RepID=A0A485LSQ9_9STRA|nr:hypothetical protein As57867_024940 [Aphanomyces stellatus]VFU01649.1 Aste57867_25018 [Aphanomyces stellatus]